MSQLQRIDARDDRIGGLSLASAATPNGNALDINSAWRPTLTNVLYHP